MGQLGFFDLNRRYESLDEKSDPLVAIAAMVPFESFRSKLKAALIKGELRASDATRKSLAGRKPWDQVMIFKALVLQALYNLSDDQAEYQLRDRLSVHAVSRFGTGGYGSRRQDFVALSRGAGESGRGGRAV